MTQRKKRRSTSDGLKRGEGFIVEHVRADGSVRYQARCYERGVDGRPRLVSRSFNNRDAAEDHLRETARDKRDGRYVSTTDMTVRRILDDHLSRGHSRWKASTYATYRQRAYTHIIPRLGTMRLVELTTSRVQHWIDARYREMTVEAGVDDEGVQRGNAAKTVQEATRVLSSAMAEAVRLDIIRTNPVKGTMLPASRPRAHQTWAEGEVGRVFATVAGDPMWHALYRVALLTGMRPGELRSLQWPDLDMEGRAITIRRTMTRGANNRETVGTTTKSKRVRSVTVPPSAVEALRAWKSRQAEIQIRAEAWDSRRFIFTTATGHYLGGTTWQRHHAEVCRRAGVPEITLHEMRHTFATVMLVKGVHPLIVSKILGHSKIAITLDLYSHPDESLHRAAVDALSDSIDAGIGTTTLSENLPEMTEREPKCEPAGVKKPVSPISKGKRA